MSHNLILERTLAIKFIQTGGTIDKQYNLSDGSLYFTQSSLPDMLKQGRCTVDITFHALDLVDSLDMDDSYRSNLVSICNECKESRIIISHGTDTMAKTAQALEQLKSDKTIVIFGAMIPFSIDYSDAFFNLGAAMTAVQCLSKGVYVVMNGQVFNANNVVKNRAKGEFEALS